jgi:hypothetical protein
MSRLEPCRHCGLSVFEVREKLRAMLEVIRRELPGPQAEAIISELETIWTRR